MKRYRVVLTQTAEKELRRLPSQVIEKIVTVLRSLEENPRPAGCKKLKGYKNLWRVRVGDYRLIYAIEEVIMLIDVREIGHRKDIYDKL
ncbi:MAG: type II toxin-antitoxin system RelE/ParE family toxin [Chitinophagaceae bacterium]|nr:type II toxin-antitoxin system RelE/ParE family toxin [Chitinophagaceae bacterium]